MRDDLEGSWPEIDWEVKSTRTWTVGEGQPGEDGKEKDPEEPEVEVEDEPDDDDEPDDGGGEGPGGGRATL